MSEDILAKCRLQAASCRKGGAHTVATFLDDLADEIEGLRARVLALETALRVVDAADAIVRAKVDKATGKMLWPPFMNGGGHG